MTKRSHIVAVAVAFALMGASLIAAVQQRPNRVSDQDLRDLLSRIDTGNAVFRANFDRAIDRRRINGNRPEDNINQSVNDFKQATDRLRDRVPHRRPAASAVESVLRRASVIDGFMVRNALDDAVERSWQSLRGDLDELARAYGVTWNWTGSQNVRSRLSDQQVGQLWIRTKKNPRYTANERSTGPYQGLTGTYQLESSRGDDPGRAVEQATGALPSNRRRSAFQRLMNRLNAPEMIAIDRHEDSVTIASSRGQRVTFEADGQVRTEEGNAGRTVNTRATLYGDRLVVATTGNGGNDFTVAFEPIDNGRNLRVTRRIYDDSLLRPVTVQGFYRKTSDKAQWDIYPTFIDAITEGAKGDFVVGD